MTVLTLLIKAHNLRQLRQVADGLEAWFENLVLDFKVLGAPVNGWVQISLSGEDAVIATHYINKEVGTCPVSVKKVNKLSVLKGYITKVDTDNGQLLVDVGVFEPKTIQAHLPLAYLQAQLVNGSRIGLKEICKRYALRQNLPLEINVIGSDLNENGLKAELSVPQVEKMRLWQRSLLDRLIVLGATGKEVSAVIERTKLNRDIIDVEQLGFFEHALTCKLGTDAAGLIPKIGKYLRNAQFVVFSPAT